MSSIAFVVASALGLVVSLIMLVCWIAVLVTEIRNRNLQGSLLSLLPPAAYYVGWKHAKKHHLERWMRLWTIGLCLSLAMRLLYAVAD